MINITQVEADYYKEVCEAYKEDEQEAKVNYPDLDVGVCNWVIKGFTIQGWFNLIQQINHNKAYVENLQSDNEFHRQQLLNLYKAMEKINDD